VVLATIAFIGACTSTSSPTSPAHPGGSPSAPRPVVIDTDMAADDWLAILFVLGRPDLDVKAITVAGTGEAHCEAGVRHALDLAALAGQPDVPVACGRETPLAGTHAFPQSWRERVDSFLGLTLPESPSKPSAESAVALLARTFESSAGGGVTLLALGPLTNPAELLRQSPGVATRIAAIYVMGGAVEVDGNVGMSGVGIDNRFAEWNFYADPLAADAILRSELPITLIPLDATNHVPMTTAFVERFAAAAGTSEARFAKDLFGRLHGDIAAGFTSFWDPFAAAVLADDTFAEFDERSLGVVHEEGLDSGRIISVATGPATRFARTADAERFERLFIDALNAGAN
jgi:inosine-uridine nucleoside N-ribohydrolase